MADSIARKNSKLRFPVPIDLGGTGFTTLAQLYAALGVSAYNYIHNGSMQVAQFGTSFPGVNAVKFAIDRWLMNLLGPVVTVAQEAYTANPEFQFAQSVTVTTAVAAPTAGQFAYLGQNLEGINVKRLVGKPFNVTFEVTSSVPGTYCFSFRNSVSDRSFVAEFVIAAANVMQVVTIPVPAGLITAGTWDWANGVGLQASITLMAGTTLQTATKNAWHSSGAIGTANQVNFCATVGNKITVTGFRLNDGLIVQPFPPTPYDDDLRHCRRYAYRMYPSMSGVCLNTNGIARVGQPHPVQMRGAPILPAGPNINMWDGALLTNGAVQTSYCTAEFFEADFIQGGGSFVAGRPGKVFSSGAGQYIDVRADI